MEHSMNKADFEKCLSAWLLDPGYKTIEDGVSHEHIERRLWAIHAAYRAGFKDAGGEVK